MTIVQLDDFRIELSQPLKDRPDVIVITASDGRRAILGDGQDLFTVDEYRQIDRQNRLDKRDEQRASHA
jgi:hypothetical protein